LINAETGVPIIAFEKWTYEHFIHKHYKINLIQYTKRNKECLFLLKYTVLIKAYSATLASLSKVYNKSTNLEINLGYQQNFPRANFIGKYQIVSVVKLFLGKIVHHWRI
jgi:hypothetical protein